MNSDLDKPRAPGVGPTLAGDGRRILIGVVSLCDRLRHHRPAHL